MFVLIELKDIDLIENPFFDFSIEDMCLLFSTIGLIILKFFIAESITQKRESQTQLQKRLPATVVIVFSSLVPLSGQSEI